MEVQLMISNKNIGLWLDRSKACIVTLTNGDMNYYVIDSHIDGQIRLHGGSRGPTPYGPQDISSEQKLLERGKNQIRQYINTIIQEIKDAKNIYIFGPGEAKYELAKKIRTLKILSNSPVSIETEDKMTDNQIIAKVKEFFTS